MWTAEINRISRAADCKDSSVPMSHEKYKNCPYQICGELEVDDYPEAMILSMIQDRQNIKLFGPILNATYNPAIIESRWGIQDSNKLFIW